MRQLLHFALLAAALCLVACEETIDADPGPAPPPSGTAPQDGRISCNSSTDCASGRFCTDGRCLSSCSGPADCAADERCDDRAALCRPLACEVNADCPRHEVCEAGACVFDPSLECIPGSILCEGTAVVTCSPTAEVTRRDCAPEGTCAVRNGIGVCEDLDCVIGERQCLDMETVGVCNASGGVDQEPCAQGEFCRQGECSAQVCSPGSAPRCDGDDLVVCDVRGARETLVEVCTAGCTDGACESTGVVDGCTPGTALPCYGGTEPSSLLGPCNYGERRCGEDGRFGECEDWTPPSEENCVNLDCPETPRTRVIAADVAEEVRDHLAAAGLTVTSVGGIQTAQLDNADIVISSATQAIVDAGRLRTWVTEEGGVLIVYGTGASTDCTLVNPSITALGARFDCSYQVTGNASSLASHPLMAGLNAAGLPISLGTGVQRLEQGSWSVLYRSAGGDASLAGDLACGKAILLGHRDLATSAGWPAARPFWNNVIQWVAR